MMTSRANKLIMGTRGSPLALAQSRQTAAAIMAANPGLIVEERIIRTTGDAQQSMAVDTVKGLPGAKGAFTLEIEQALLNGEIDFAVHSLKDLPPELPEGLCLAAVPKRADPCDVCILREVNRGTSKFGALPFLPQNARVGTSSLRRSAQLLHLRPDLRIETIRGNIDTRLRKLKAQELDAIILASAGLERLGIAAELSKQQTIRLDEHEFVPSPGQGALALEARADNDCVLQVLRSIEDAPTRAAITAERAAMRALNAGCATPVGARAVVDKGQILLWAVVLPIDGRRRIYEEKQGPVEEAENIGRSVALRLIQSGANEFLQS